MSASAGRSKIQKGSTKPEDLDLSKLKKSLKDAEEGNPRFYIPLVYVLTIK